MSGKEPNWNQMIEQNLIDVKMRTSMIKGEMTDSLTEMISENLKQFLQIDQQLTQRIEEKDKEIADLKKQLEEKKLIFPQISSFFWLK